jgi:transposase, IS30 family
MVSISERLEAVSRYLLVLPLSDITTTTVVTAVTAAFHQLPPIMRRSLTWDRGVEMTRHAGFTAATGIPVYLLRRLLPLATRQQRAAPTVLSEKTDLSVHDADQVQAVVNPLNHRPRQRLGWQNPHEVFWSANLAIIA